MRCSINFWLCAHSVPLISVFFASYLKKQQKQVNRWCILTPGLHLHSMFIVHFVEYLKDLLEKLFICIENGSKFVHSEIVFNCVYLQCSRGVTGILLFCFLSRALWCFFRICFATQRLEMIDANIYMAYIWIYTYIFLLFLCHKLMYRWEKRVLYRGYFWIFCYKK